MASLSRKQLFALAVCAGAAVANLYYVQPLLAQIGQAFHAISLVGWIAAATQVGYTLGIVFALPLGDLVDRRQLTVSLAAILVVGTLACAMVSSFAGLVAASLFVGFGASIAQILVPLAADLAPENQQAHAIGVVVSGLLAGILLARTVSGLVGEAFGWRAMFFVASVAAVVLGLTLRRALPKLAPKNAMPYLQLLGSLFHLLGEHPKLLVACGIQACLFAVFCAFWSILSLLLSNPPFEMGPAMAGAFGLVGVVGVAAANRSGKLIAKLGQRTTLRLGLVCVALAWGVMAADVSIRGLIIGVILLDFGLSIANVANQSLILSLNPQARSRINTIYISIIFLGGTLGTSLASIAWGDRGWGAVCLVSLVLAAISWGIHFIGGALERGQK